MSERYELSTTVGPCTAQEAFALADAILDLPEAKAAGAGGVSVSVKDSDD